jgi:hypothetical protein
MASTSVLALGLTAAPVAVDFDLGQPAFPQFQAALADSGPSCFTGTTRILMADGSEKPISEVRIGELVMASNGRANRVVDIERPILGARRLYALNGGPYFVTSEHPFMTVAGWKAVDPAATAAENPRLAVSRLQPGDCLTTLQAVRASNTAGNLALAGLVLETTVLVHLDARAADPATPLFNLLLDGDHAYFAEGYLVHNKGGDDGGEGGGGEGGDDGGEGGDDGAEAGESGDDDSEAGEAGDDVLKVGESGDDDSEAGDSGPSSAPPSSFGGVEQVGPDLTENEEEDAISAGWQ